MYGEMRTFPRRTSWNPPVSRLDLSAEVRIHISNLPLNVDSTDIVEMFEHYTLKAATVNYNEEGEPTGTADVVTDRATAREIMSNFDGAALDGQLLNFYLIDDTSKKPSDAPKRRRIYDRVEFPDRPRGIYKKRYPYRRGYKRGSRMRRSSDHFTEEELDREIDKYMKSAKKKEDGEPEEGEPMSVDTT
ncbi:unnamed protein product [Gongylonema pulchrum]|uniref:RRM domain-containing protein n=1 Tax=Gongylonema pulchrum TaxID=637853 RepID=A0A183E4C7_9BILA|nr:unnamed protein product [Gongylonema pulchrum]